MNIFKKFIFIILCLVLNNLKAQTVIKHASGNVYQIINNIKIPIVGLNTLINDTTTILLSPNSYMIVDRNGQIFMIKQKDYLDGIKFKDVNNSIELDESTGFWNKVFAAFFNNSFDNKKKIDGLFKSRFQGVQRSLFNSVEKWKVLPSYKSKIDWPKGKDFQIESARSKILDINRVNTSFLIDKNVLSNCVPCSVRVDNEFRGLIEIISQEKHFEHMLESLFLNINSNNDIEISQFCIVRLLIDNDLFINANYYIDKFSDNKLIKEYIVSLNLD